MKTMIKPAILEKLEELPESLQTEVLHYIEFLIEKPKRRGNQNYTQQPLLKYYQNYSES
jgi:hypothetical protein